jgi:hypothetical protein
MIIIMIAIMKTAILVVVNTNSDLSEDRFEYRRIFTNDIVISLSSSWLDQVSILVCESTKYLSKCLHCSVDESRTDSNRGVWFESNFEHSENIERSSPIRFFGNFIWEMTDIYKTMRSSIKHQIWNLVEAKFFDNRHSVCPRWHLQNVYRESSISSVSTKYSATSSFPYSQIPTIPYLTAGFTHPKLSHLTPHTSHHTSHITHHTASSMFSISITKWNFVLNSPNNDDSLVLHSFDKQIFTEWIFVDKNRDSSKHPTMFNISDCSSESRNSKS